MTGMAVADDRDLEIARLRGGLGDLMSLLALSASWVGREAHDVGRTLGEALYAILDLDLVFVALDEHPETVFALGRHSESLPPASVDAALRRFLGADPRSWPAVTRGTILGARLSVATMPLGSPHGPGMLAVATARPDFPTDAERLVLNVARNQAVLALQEERLRREERLKAGELSAVALIEGLPGLVAILGPDGRVERVNRQIREYCGQEIEGLRDWGSNGIVHPEDLPHVAEIFGASIASGAPYKIEQRLRRFDGEYRWFDNRGHPLRDGRGSIMAWHVLLSDIDDLKRAEKAVRARERELRQQAETFPQMLWSATADGNIDYCNERLLEYSGLAAEDVMNERWVNLIHPDDRGPATAIWLRCIATGDPYSVEVRQFHVADQTHRWVLTLALPLRDGEGRIVKWYGSCVDIHDRKLAEEAVKASERYLTQTVETIPQNLFGAGADGLVNYINPQLRDWFGRADDTIMAEEWVHLVHPDDRASTVEAWTQTVLVGTPYRREVRFMHHGGEYRWCEAQARPLRDADGDIVAWHGVVNDIHDRKLAEDALKASEQNLRLIIDTIPALAWSARADGTADFFNRHYLDYVGRSHEKLDRQWIDLVHPDDLEVITSAWDRARETGVTSEAEARLRRHDGAYRWFLFQTSPLRDESGKLVKWYGVNTDIEDRKRAEQDLAARERTLREAHDHLSQAQRLSQTGSFTTDVIADTHIWSEELYRILEYDRAEMPTFLAFRDRIHADDLAGFDAGFRRAMAERVEFDEVFRIVTPKGNTKYLHAIAHFLPGDAGRPLVTGSIQDISESKRREQELLRAAYLLETAERISETGSFRWDLTENKLVWSAEMYRIHEIDESIEPRYPELLSTVHPDDVDMINNKTQQSFKGIGAPEDGYRLLMPDGRVKYLKTAYRVITHEDGRVESVGVAQDVTQRRLAEDALDKLRSELAHITRVSTLGELAASIAHEVNQPLAGIITNASTCLRMLAADPPDTEGAIKTAQRSIRDGNRASEVIRRLRGLYRKQGFVRESLDLNEAAREVIAICTHDLQRRHIMLSIELDPALQPVNGDRIQLQQVILNLVLNAADAVDDSGRRPRQIVIETSGAGPGMAQLAVRDTGRGLSAEALSRVFEAFYTTKPHGMGIGLSVSKTIVDRHEGTLWASPNDNGGTTFAFAIPLEQEAELPATDQPE